MKQGRSALICTLMMSIGAISTWAISGCQTPPASAILRKPSLTVEEAASVPLEENILSVAAFYPSINPWIYTDDRSRVRGLVISGLYLEGPNHLGVFGDGIIRPRIYVLDSKKENPKTPKLVKQWSFDPEQAKPFRSMKRKMAGYGYRFHLLWDENMDLAGKDIRVTVTFERRDGTLLYSGHKEFRVPSDNS